MSKVVNTLSLVVMFVAASTLDAQVLAPPINFDCDASAGYASAWTTGIRSADLRVQGMIQFVFLREHFRWAPEASVLLISRSNVRNGLQLSWPSHRSSDLLQADIVSIDDPTGRTVMTHPRKGRPLPFALTISKSGEVNVTIGDKATTLKVNGLEQDRLVLSCSTAHVKFSDIVITSVSGD